VSRDSSLEELRVARDVVAMLGGNLVVCMDGLDYGIDGAAARLGLKPGTLQSKMWKLGIEGLAH
jgi:hypothetical protein